MYLKFKTKLFFPWGYITSDKSGRHHFWFFFGPITEPEKGFYGLGLSVGPLYVVAGLQREKASCTN